MNKDDRKNKAVMGPQQEKAIDDKFPVGIRVLCVDDDQTCLFWMENLLKSCQYNVTTTLYAREALEMLRENKSSYDIVITDVQMPDIDGFQLLETIGLEMDLPVIMMSIYNHQDYVSRGVHHGAVDYLLKPVRLEEIQNIWQHVLRKRKGLDKGKKVIIQDKSSPGAGDGGVGNSIASALGDTSDKRRRDPSDKDHEDYEEEDDSGRENEDQTSQKRPRVVWTPELHRKFVSAVNQLGIDKAVPKKILDTMDVEGLTRENVASHLQKYRMYLKRISNGNPQQSMFGALGGRYALDAMGCLGGRLHNSLPSGYPSSLSGILSGRVNSGTGVDFRSISSSDLIQSGQNLRSYINPLAKLHPNVMPSLQNGSLFQGMQGGLEQDPTQATKAMTHLADFNPGLGATGLRVSENLMDPKVVLNDSSSRKMLHAPSQFSQTGTSPVPGALRIGGMPGSPSNNGGIMNHSGTSDSWKSAAQFPQSTFQMGGSGSGNGTFTQDQHLPINNNAMNGIASTGIQPQLLGFPQMLAPLRNSNNGMQGEPGMHNAEHIKQQEYTHELNNLFGSLNPIMTSGGSIMGSMGVDQNHLVANGGNFVGRQTGILGTDPNFKQNNDSFVPEQANLPQDNFIPNNVESLDEIMNTMMRRDNNGSSSLFMDSDFNFDVESL